MDNAVLFVFKGFSGVNNVDPSTRLPVNVQDKNAVGLVSDVSTIQNLDIDNSFYLKSRPGADLKLSGTDFRSIWSNGDTCLVVDGTVLYQLMADYSLLTLKSGLRSDTIMSFEQINDYIYMTDGSWIGYYKDMIVYDLTDPAITYKHTLPAGNYLTSFQSQLFVASGKVLYISDSLCDHYDTRYGFRVFSSDITMIKAVDSGIYAADEDATWFISRTPKVNVDEPDQYRRQKVLDVGAISNTAIVTNGSEIGEGMNGNVLVWTSLKGICVGDNEGQVKVVTEERYHLPDYVTGSAVIREVSGVNHYIATLA